MKAGWIKISRDINEHWIASNAEWFRWWIDLLLLASWKNRKIVQDGHLIELEKGQLICSLSFFCSRWKKSKPTIIRFLNLLKKCDMIETQTLYRYTTILTICNFESYQQESDTLVDTLDNSDVNSLDDTLVDTNRRKERNNNILKKENIKERKEVDSQNSSTYVATATQKVDYSKLLEFFNQTISESGSVIKEIRQLTERRKLAIQARARENGKESLMEVIKQAAKSDFLNGHNDRSWVADFDWLMRPNNFVKVLEGNYNNNGNDRRRGTEVTAAKPEDYDTTF